MFEFKNLKPGLYQVRVVAPGFVVYEDKEVSVTARVTTDLDIQLSVELEEQQVTVDNRSVSTDADNNAHGNSSTWWRRDSLFNCRW